MGYVTTWMGDRFIALLMSLMALRLTLGDRKPLSAEFFFISEVTSIRFETQQFFFQVCLTMYTILYKTA